MIDRFINKNQTSGNLDCSEVVELLADELGCGTPYTIIAVRAGTKEIVAFKTYDDSELFRYHCVLGFNHSIIDATTPVGYQHDFSINEYSDYLHNLNKGDIQFKVYFGYRGLQTVLSNNVCDDDEFTL